MSAPRPPRPPRISRFVLRRALTRDVRESILGDLDERFADDAAALGAPAARRRFRRKTFLLVFRFLFERVRDVAISVARFRFSALDLRLGIRMLTRYPVLTVIGTGSLAFGIAIGAAVFAFISLLLWPTLPLPEGDRIVTVAQHDLSANEPEPRLTSDYLRWRNGAHTLTDFMAARGTVRNLQMGDGVVESTAIAEVTASMTRLTRTMPIVGRGLGDDDARADAPPVMLIGERVWRERFGADPAIVGRAVLVGESPVTIVGVMPAAFRFPSIYEAWMPLKIDERAKPREGMTLRVWARLGPGVTREQSDAELALISAQSATDWPATHAHLKAWTESGTGSLASLGPAERAMLASINLGVGLLVLLISGNVALLMFARAATRESEIVVRTALGASRARLVAQFLAESLILSSLAFVAGVALAQRGLRFGLAAFAIAASDGRPLPFWMTDALPPISVAYAIGLACFAAAVTGILPALKITRGFSPQLRESTAGGGGLKFGGVWTVLIVSQIAVTVTAPVILYFVKRDGWQIEAREIGVPPEQYVSARLSQESFMTADRFDAAVRRVREDMTAAPGVSHVTLADQLPLMWNGHFEIDLDAGGAAPPEDEFNGRYRISTAAVDPNFFRTFEAPAIAGRVLVPSDFTSVPRVVVVNQPFVDIVLGGRNAIGRRIRYHAQFSDDSQAPPADQQWLEIVGVVRDLGMAVAPDPKVAGAYVPLRARSLKSVCLAARVSGDMTPAMNALRSIVNKADPTLRVADVQPLSKVTAGELRFIEFWTRLLAGVSLSALVLALSGIYAVMSFAVSRRTREIGIRVALGSRPSSVLLTILRRPLIQVATGILVGSALIFALSGQVALTFKFGMGLVAYTAVMLVVCLLACIIPARRALKVDPIAALRME